MAKSVVLLCVVVVCCCGRRTADGAGERVLKAGRTAIGEQVQPRQRRVTADNHKRARKGGQQQQQQGRATNRKVWIWFGKTFTNKKKEKKSHVPISYAQLHRGKKFRFQLPTAPCFRLRFLSAMSTETVSVF